MGMLAFWILSNKELGTPLPLRLRVSGILSSGKWNQAARFGHLGAPGVLSSAEGYTGQAVAVQA